ncbi:MAG: cyclodeaminase/cyclohydrolase family protein [Candidatus Omnitrophica bacterium]|nr:cyclodeaminase/cyclohydrolase family protein [Candidatus Omnitrophota bacterium]
MISYANKSLTRYLQLLAAREPVPGGGSAAAVSGALGASLIAMSARYSVGKGKPRAVESRFARLIVDADKKRDQLAAIITQDAQAYLNVVAVRKSGDKARLKAANRAAALVPRALITICRKLLRNIPFLKKEANRYLLSDVLAAEVFLTAAIQAARAMIEANQ